MDEAASRQEVAPGARGLGPAKDQDDLAVFDPAWIDALRSGLSPELVRNLLSSCLGSMEQYLAELRRCAVAGTLEDARRAAHDLKGICAQFGALQASAVARRIETETAGVAALREALPALETCLGGAVAEIRRIAQAV